MHGARELSSAERLVNTFIVDKIVHRNSSDWKAFLFSLFLAAPEIEPVHSLDEDIYSSAGSVTVALDS